MIILTVLQGPHYFPQRAYDLRKQLDAVGCSDRLVALTDHDIEGEHGGVEFIPLITCWPEQWAKVEIFRPDLADRFGAMLYIDVSVLVVGPIDDFLSPGVEGPVITSDFYYGGPSQSVLNFAPHSLGCIWSAFNQRPAYWMAEGDKMQRPNFRDQILVREVPGLPAFQYWQDLYPGQLCSYKVHCGGGYPKGSRIVKFHGQPKPWDILSSLAPEGDG